MNPNLNRIALIIWLRYEIDCEEYDRKQPGVWKHSEWIPIFDGRVDGATNSRAFARRRKVKAHEELRISSIPIELKTEREYAARLPFEEAKELLAHLLAS